MMVKTSRFQKGSPAAVEEGGEGRGGGRGEEGGRMSCQREVDVGVDGVKSEIKVERRRGHG